MANYCCDARVYPRGSRVRASHRAAPPAVICGDHNLASPRGAWTAFDAYANAVGDAARSDEYVRAEARHWRGDWSWSGSVSGGFAILSVVAGARYANRLRAMMLRECRHLSVRRRRDVLMNVCCPCVCAMKRVQAAA